VLSHDSQLSQVTFSYKLKIMSYLSIIFAIIMASDGE